MMSEIDQIIKAAIELQQEGKTPSTALLKVRTLNQFSLPTLIRGLKGFKSLDSEQYSKWLEPPVNSAPKKKAILKISLEDRVSLLEQQIADLITEHKKLNKRILELETGEKRCML